MSQELLIRYALVAAITLLLVWRIYRRIRRLVGRQQLGGVRPWLSVTLFPLLLTVLAVGASLRSGHLAVLFGCVATGVLLGLYSLKQTRFEVMADALYYTPHAPIGIALSMLLVARVLYRFAHLALLGNMAGSPTTAPASGTGMATFGGSPLTLAVIGLMIGYYVCYAAGLLRWRSQVRSHPVDTST